MHIACRDDRLAELFAQVQDRSVIVLQYAHIPYGAVVDEETVVADRLDLEVVVKGSDLFQFLLARTFHDRAVQLAHTAGGADEDALAVLDQQALGDDRVAVEILEVGLGHHLVEVLQSLAVLHKQDHMVGLGHVRAAQGVVDRLDIIHRLGPLLLQHGQELFHDPRDHHGVVRRAVVVELREVEMVGDDVELEALELGQQCLRERQGVQEHGVEAQIMPQRRRGHKAHIEVCIVGDDRPIPDKGDELLHRLLLGWGTRHVAVADTGQLRDVGRDMPLGVDEGIEGLKDIPAGEADRADLGHAVVLRIKARGLDIESHELSIQRQFRLADDGAVAVHIIEEVDLAAVDDLHAGLLAGLPHIRESLQHAVIGHGNGGHAPVGGALHDRLGLGKCIHRGKAGMHMQLDTLLRRVVRAHITLALHDVARVEHHVVIVFGIYDFALHDQVVAGIDLLDHGLVVVRTQEPRHAHRICPVGNIEAEHGAAALGERTARDCDHVALDADTPRFKGERVHRHRMHLDAAPV